MATPALTPGALAAIASHPLKGNVRELENLLHRAIALGEEGQLHVDFATPDLAEQAGHAAGFAAVQTLQPPSALAITLPDALPHDLQAWLDQHEREVLVRALREAGFNRTATAARLGISLRQIRYRIARLNIAAPNDGEAASDPEAG